MEFRRSGLIEFEPVDPEVLDDEAEEAVDANIDADPLSVNFGRTKDIKPPASERMLAGAAIDWLVSFPATDRPRALCDRFPHVANRLARDWSDSARSRQSLQALAADGRWGSTGFPAQVQGEVLRLLQSLGAAQR